MINNWFLWGLGWLFMPRMTIGIMIAVLSSYDALGTVLAIFGAIIDLATNG